MTAAAAASGPRETTGRPRFSLVTAVYDVAAYLPRFLASIEQQTFDHGRIQVIAVDDGSTDASGSILDRWAESAALAEEAGVAGLEVRVLHHGNQGQGAARNAGLALATGEWVGFADPDDFLDPGYLAAVDACLTAHPSSSIAAAHVVVYDEETDSLVDRHPLTWRFVGGDRLVRLDREPDFFQLFVSSAFVRLDDLRADGLEFDPRIRPNFEDGHLLARYLVRQREPSIVFVDSARYLYRRRADQSSAIQTAWRRPEKFTAVLRYGYLSALHDAVEQRGAVPPWLQSMIIYELSWYLRNEEMMFGGLTAAMFGVEDEYHALFAEVASHLDEDRVYSFAGLAIPPSRRQVIAHGYAGVPWCSPVVVDQVDPSRGCTRLLYRFTGPAPRERVTLDGQVIEPEHGKTRPLTYSGRTLLTERLLWVASAARIELDGRPVETRRGWPSPARPPGQRTRVRWNPRRLLRAVRGAALGVLARLPPVRRVFADAWLLMDRRANAHDNAEHLFDWVRANRPDLNAWFVVGRGTPAWRALTARGVDRLLAYGSARWVLACLHARYLVSSHADAYVYDPVALRSRFTRPRWQFVWLQHGVTKDDLSRWLNRKPMALMVTTTPAEHASIVADGTPYQLTTREVVRTGMPRLDRLAELGRRHRPTTITIMPTWREFLLGKQLGGEHARALLPDFMRTPYATSWQAVLRSDRLHELAESAGLRLLFMPHPNIQPYLDRFQLPAWVVGGSYTELDVQQALAETAVLVTDYSSVAFDVASLGRPVVYYQFDADRVFGGEHLTRPGYFDYGTDGFGPVVTQLAGLENAVADALANPAAYADRVARAFPGDLPAACPAVVAEIEALLG